MLIFGAINSQDLANSAVLLWRPIITISSIVVLTGVLDKVGTLKKLSWHLFRGTRLTTLNIFNRVFAVTALVALAFNNDSAILLVLPTVLLMAKSRFGKNTKAIGVMALTVFMATGVAGFVFSNPMNLIVAEFAGINFNQYAAVMLPVAAVGWLTTYAMLRIVFRKELKSSVARVSNTTQRLSGVDLGLLGILLMTLVSYSVASTFGVPVWMIALAGASVATLFASNSVKSLSNRDLVFGIMSWVELVEVLIFLSGVVVISFGLQRLGIVDALSSLYGATDNFYLIGIVSALGSAAINNHPMGHLNMLAIGSNDPNALMAALVGGDLGPRMWITGSLAGLLWISILKQQRVRVSLAEFTKVGTIVTIPTTIVCLFVLTMLVG